MSKLKKKKKKKKVKRKAKAKASIGHEIIYSKVAWEYNYKVNQSKNNFFQ